MGRKRTYKQYSKEYKEEAVALVKQLIESQLEGKSLSIDEREELKCLLKENKNLRVEKGILKKVNAFFAKEMK